MAALAAIVAAFYDALGAYGGLTRFATGMGFAVLVTWPALFVLSLSGRVVTHVWQPRALAASLTDPGGGAPRLAAWLVAIVLGAALLSMLTHQVVWVFWRTTAFKPRTMSMALGPVMVSSRGRRARFGGGRVR